MPKEPLLEISNLTLRPAREALLSHVSLTVERGTLHALVGPNGAGKTTLLSAILGLVAFEGRVVARWTGSGRIAYVPQQFQVDRTLPITVADFLALTRQRRPVCFGVERAARRRIALLLERVGLGGFDTRALSVLSGGELRRVLLANALDPLPELLILDEPESGLDESSARWLDDTLQSLKGEMTVLMVSHDSERVRRLADRVTNLSFPTIPTTPTPPQMTDFLEYPFLVRGFICVLLLAPLLGGLSHLVVARRMAFFSAALGQAAITGVCVGLLIGEPLNAPYGGMFGFCLLSALAMVYAKRRSKLPPDALIGVFLALTLGLGLCLLVAVTRQFNVHQVEAILFGSLLTVTDTDLVLLVAAFAVVALLLFRHYNELLLDSLSRPLAAARGINSAFLEYGFAIVLTIAILVSLKMIGALLVEALIIVPAAAARNIAIGTRSYLVWSVMVAFAAGAGGLMISTRVLVPTGGAVVLAASLIFFITLGVGTLRRSS